ncbi:Ran binding protein [Theileria orientalis strain Shintoku]|uniref:Ran binding protein n=1 Tax=Theileria orientalis strain Shintoku TaxID=869250 RepID=J4D8B1_THEOR|nr:Ran binding protein [Theileria orientalis strain Shintoku]PVC51495.1 Ran binding protein [Theileria orientalis]BAM40685.1 Ran binding protein [Theileria orientalis strain Shintoku]|eukprot:XP_009690986.1 Ran binding protein [Theileria orientalis strain Shintoku]
MERKEGDWICPDSSCGNINFSKRTKCNICGTLRPREQPSKAPGTQKQGDWTCNKCGNLNWARRTHCNICNTVKSTQEPEDRLGRGGGYFDLDDPRDRKEHHSDDEEYDEFGRKKKKGTKAT